MSEGRDAGQRAQRCSGDMNSFHWRKDGTLPDGPGWGAGFMISDIIHEGDIILKYTLHES